MLLLLAAALAGACAGKSAPPPLSAPRAVVIEPAYEMSIEELAEAADLEYRLGVEAQQAGDRVAADDHFDTAIQVFMDADMPLGQEGEFRLAFNDLVTRVQAQRIDDFQMAMEPASTELPEESIPVLTNAELAMLRARMVETLPAMPRFSIPVPVDNPRVLEAVEYLTTNRREVITEGLSRGTRFLPYIQEIFAEAGLPTELAYIPLIESLFKPVVRSRASAVGLWQLMAPTARLYGLRVDWYVDERRDPIKSTQAIAQFIQDYYGEFGDWHLAIAAYNGGKGRVARALQRAGVEDFWSLATTRYLPRETREFVPKILAAMIIGTEPEAYGLEIEQQPLYQYDAVTIDSMTDLEVIAEAAGSTLQVIQDLNPQLLRRTTPNTDAYTIRVPRGSGAAFRVAYAAIPEDERVRIVEHSIRTGETLSDIAAAYGTSIAAISDMNGITNRNRIRAGQTLLIPAGDARTVGAPVTARADLVQGAGLEVGQKVQHTVRRGESLWLIANAYGTTVANLKRWNSLTSDRLNQGDRLDVYYRGTAATAGATPATPEPATHAAATASNATVPEAEDNDAVTSNGTSASRKVSYTVQRGDSLYTIAQVHGVQISELRRWNGLSSDRIFPGDTLLIHTDSGGAPVTTTYTVRRGDTLSGIARRYGVTVAELCSWNSISTRTTLFPGNRLQIRSRATTQAR